MVESSDLSRFFWAEWIDSGLGNSHCKTIQQYFKNIHRFFDGEYDEAPFAKLVAEKYTDHYEIRIGFDNLVNDIEKLLNNYGEPFWQLSHSQLLCKLGSQKTSDGNFEMAMEEIYILEAIVAVMCSFYEIWFFNANLLIKSAASAIKDFAVRFQIIRKSKYNYLYRTLQIW